MREHAEGREQPGGPGGVDDTLAVRSPGFRAFLTTQFLGAFNDNLFRFTLLTLIAVSTTGELSSEGRQASVAQALFALPFIVFVALFGSLADRYAKHRIMVAAKAVEVLLMVLAVAAFASGSLTFLMVLLFLMATQSAFFGPAKYGYLGEHVAPDQLVRANGQVYMTTFVAIILGEALGPLIYDRLADHLGWGALLLVLIALAGWFASRGIPTVPAARPGLPLATNPLPWLRETWAGFRHDRKLLYALGGSVHFYAIAGALQFNLLTYARDILGLQASAGFFLATAAVGICLGSLGAHRLSRGQLELGLVPLGAVTMSLGLIALGLVGGPLDAPGLAGVWNLVAPFLCVLILGAAGGLFVVPLNALLQHTAPADGKGSYLAFANMVSFVGVALSALLIWLPRELDAGPRLQALVMGLVSLVGTVISVKVLPVALARFVAWVVAHTLYRIRVLHPERLPSEGGALLVVNHVSWVDWLILIGTTRRHMHFLIHRGYFEWWPVRWLLELAGCIPVAAGDPREVLDASLAAAGARVEAGELVVVFVEGSVTRTGNLLTVRSGYRRIVQGRHVPVIPVHLDGLWGSLFSHAGGKLLWKLPRFLNHPVTVTYGNPLGSDARPHEVRTAIQRLSTEAWEQRKPFRHPLHVRLLLSRRRSWKRNLHDADGRSLSRGRLLAEALALRDELRERLPPTPAPFGPVSAPTTLPPPERRVALLMDQGLDAARAIVALLAAGRVPMPLDTSLADDVLAEILARHRVPLVVATPAHAARVQGVTVLDIAGAWAAVPPGPVQRWHRALWWRSDRAARALAFPDDAGDVDAPAAVVFSSGVTESPKGVVLSHFAVGSNITGVLEVLDPPGDDVLLAASPVAHAFGFGIGLWLPLLTHLGVVWHDRPEDGPAVGAAVRRHGVTLLAASPHHLQVWLRAARRSDFGSVRYALSVGARLLPSLRTAFHDHFGLAPVECYSASECGPVIALNTPDVRALGVFHQGSKAGSVGHPLPGVTLDVVEPGTGARLPPGLTGLLRVATPARMSGYLDAAERSAEVLTNGWFVSGDLGAVDEDGFVTLAGRAVPVDGEQVPLQQIEQAIRELSGTLDCPAAVLATPGPAGRTRLVVTYVAGCLDPAAMVAALGARGWPAAWVPAARDFLAVDALPVTGAGLVDFQALRRKWGLPY